MEHTILGLPAVKLLAEVARAEGDVFGEAILLEVGYKVADSVRTLSIALGSGFDHQVCGTLGRYLDGSGRLFTGFR
jgi:hypothetical protein